MTICVPVQTASCPKRPGCPELKNGYYLASERPGLGIELNEQLAATFPITDDPPFDMRWGNLRRRDGTVTKP